jgi:NTP pyrophosphatase (non-canonical NTP hydrolase)
MNKELYNCLDVLQEECAEVIKVASKIKRFGLDSYHPRDPENKINSVKLAEEIGDLVGTVYKLVDLLFPNVETADEGENFVAIFEEKAKAKAAKIDKYYNEFTKGENNG